MTTLHHSLLLHLISKQSKRWLMTKLITLDRGLTLMMHYFLLISSLRVETNTQAGFLLQLLHP